MRRSAGAFEPLARWIAATNLRACIGSTRSSLSVDIISSDGYAAPSSTWWYGEYACSAANWAGSSAVPYSGTQVLPEPNRW